MKIHDSEVKEMIAGEEVIRDRITEVEISEGEAHAGEGVKATLAVLINHEDACPVVIMKRKGNAFEVAFVRMITLATEIP